MVFKQLDEMIPGEALAIVTEADPIFVTMTTDMQNVASVAAGPVDRLVEMLAIKSQPEVGLDAKRLQNLLSNGPVGTIGIKVLGVVGVDDEHLAHWEPMVRVAMDLILTYNANALHRMGKQCKEPAMAKTAEILEIPATITERGQTTVPAAIRKMLALGKRDQVVFRGLADGTVVIAKKQRREVEADPVIGTFLEFLARDMAHEPARIRSVPKSLVARGKGLVKGVKVDLDAALPDDEG